MKKKLTMINNIVCAVLLVATFATMLIPCWNFVAEEKVKVRVCRDCGTEAELEEGSTKVREGYVCTGTKMVDPNEQAEEEKEEEPTQTTEPVEDAEPATDATEVTVAATEATAEVTEPAAEVTEPVQSELVEVPCGNGSNLKHYKLQEKKVTHDDSASVMEFTWFSYDNESLTNKFVSEGYVINEIVLVPFVVTLFTIAGVVFCLLNMKGTWQSIFPLASGLMTIYSFLSVPAFQEGSWMVTLVSAIALSIAGLLLFAQFMTKIVKWFVVPSYKK